MKDANMISTSQDHGQRLLKAQSLSTEEATREMVNTPYREPELVGSPMYAVVATCPNIAYAITRSQFLENPVRMHWQAAQRI